MHRFRHFGVISLTALCGAGVALTASAQGANTKTLWVAHYKVDCVGVAPQKCYLIKEGQYDEWTLWYGPIEGFHFEEGYAYEIRVAEEPVENPPADAPSVRLRLLKVLIKVAAFEQPRRSAPADPAVTAAEAPPPVPEEPMSPATAPPPTESAPTESVPAEPALDEPAPIEPVLTEPVPAEPAPAEPEPIEPALTEPTPIAPAPTKPVPIASAPTEPVPAEPAPAEPAPVEPEATEPAPAQLTPPPPAEPALAPTAPPPPLNPPSRAKRPVAPTIDGDTFRGHLSIGHGLETRSFKICSQEQSIWVEDGTGEDLWGLYRRMSGYPNRPLYMIVRGALQDPPATGFGSHYGKQLLVRELRHAAAESAGCFEDSSGFIFRAQGNEPFWQVEISSRGIAFSEMETTGRLFFSYNPPATANSRLVYWGSGRSDEPRTIQISLTEAPCEDTMADTWFSYQAAVAVGGRELTGCAVEGQQDPE